MKALQEPLTEAINNAIEEKLISMSDNNDLKWKWRLTLLLLLQNLEFYLHERDGATAHANGVTLHRVLDTFGHDVHRGKS